MFEIKPVTQITCCSKFLVYFFLALNIFISLVILLLLFLSTYDVIFLDWYQYLYLVFATIVWLLLFCVYVGKLVLIIIGKLPPKFMKYTKYIKLVWIVLNGPAIIFLLIGFIFDLVMYSNDQIAFLIYNIIYWLIMVLYGLFAGFDFYHLKYQVFLFGNSLNEETNKDDGLDNIEVKAYQEERAESVNAKMKSK